MMEKHDVVELEISPESAALTGNDLARAMGYSAPPEAIARAIEKIIPVCAESIRPSAGFAVYQIQSSEEDWIRISDVTLYTDRIIGKALSGADHVAVFAGTIGGDLERCADQFMSAGETLLGYVTDVAGSTAAEKVAGIVHAAVKDRIVSMGFTAGNRYSPGYCGWDVSQQRQLFSLLPDRFCGIEITPSSMMLPVKSVSGIIPAGLRVMHKPYACGSCSRTDCARRQR
jgi:hypothetical protein